MSARTVLPVIAVGWSVQTCQKFGPLVSQPPRIFADLAPEGFQSLGRVWRRWLLDQHEARLLWGRQSKRTRSLHGVSRRKAILRFAERLILPGAACLPIPTAGGMSHQPGRWPNGEKPLVRLER